MRKERFRFWQKWLTWANVITLVALVLIGLPLLMTRNAFRNKES